MVMTVVSFHIAMTQRRRHSSTFNKISRYCICICVVVESGLVLHFAVLGHGGFVASPLHDN